MRISDWSSDVCSTDLPSRPGRNRPKRRRSRDRAASSPPPARRLERDADGIDGRPSASGDHVVAFLRRPASAERPGDMEMAAVAARSEEHTSELQSLMRISYAVFCLKKKKYESILQRTQIQDIT